MKPKLKQALVELAEQSEPIRGRFRIASGLVYRGRLVASGVARYKTHTVMLNGAYRPEQVFLHAEADCLVRATKVLTPKQMAGSVLYVVRVKLDGSLGLAKPCVGCMALIDEFGVGSVKFTVDEERKET